MGCNSRDFNAGVQSESNLSNVYKANLSIALGKFCLDYRKCDGNFLGYLDGVCLYFTSKGIEVDVRCDSTFKNVWVHDSSESNYQAEASAGNSSESNECSTRQRN